MCSISGAFSKNAKNEIIKINNKLKHRGPDFSQIKKFKDLFLGHNLLSIVDFVKQPFIEDNYAFITNCEIYNWQELANKHKINAKNDAELLFKLIKQNKEINKLKKVLKEINGVYAFGFFWYDNGLKGYLIKDFFGVRPLWYYKGNKNFYFSSEKKALPSKIKNNSFDLNPRTILYLDFKENKTKLFYKGFYEKINIKNISYKTAVKNTKKLILNAIKSRINTKKKIGILISGGIDSSLIAKISAKYKNVICYNVSTNNGEDKKFTKLLEKKTNLNIKYINITEKAIKTAIPKVIKIIESSDPIKVSVALTFYFAAKQAKKDNIKIMLLGNGADDVFCGYSRFNKEYSLIKDTISRLRKLYENDLYRDDLIFMHFGIEARLPFLDKKLVDFVLRLPENYKITDNEKKKILRDIGKEYLPLEISNRPKKATQYGSKTDYLLGKIAKNNGFKSKSSYLNQFIKKNNTKIGILFTGGKDSVLATEILHNMNYNIKTLITIKSKNKDSYMYHTPVIDFTEKQAKAMNLPIIFETTEGEKEKELKALKNVLIKAKKQYKINGVASGALYSNYQRDRIEKIADKIGLKVFSPLWHKDQYLEVLELINKNIKAIIVKIAAYGLDSENLGKIIDKSLLLRLKDLNNEIGFNIAGEGGEYETFVIDAPLFKKKLTIIDSKKRIIDQYTSELIIKNIKLEKKEKEF